MGWAGIQNGELLRRAEELFDVFILPIRTCDISSSLPVLSWQSSCYPAIKFLLWLSLCQSLRVC
jgi:hypothetical protein